MTQVYVNEIAEPTTLNQKYFSDVTGSVLDVGCGLHPRGDVNVDLFLDSRHRRSGYGPDLDIDSIQNFVQADGRNMYMFIDRQFDTVRCHHVIEHLPAPECWKLLKELWRVTDRHLTVVCPNRYWLKFPKLQRSKNHVSNFDASIFEKVVPKLLGTWSFEAVNIYQGMFHKMIPFPQWPSLVRLDVWRCN